MSESAKKVRDTPPAGFMAQAGKGRPKGVTNKTTAALKDMILKALDGAGGIEYLRRQADENPGPFMTLVGKVLPHTIAGDAGGSPIMISQIALVPLDAEDQASS